MPTNCLSMFDHFVKLALKGLRARKAFQNIGYTVKPCFWTDSKVTLSWIFADSQIFEVFVQNYLKEIRNISKKENRHFCSTKNNHADILIREENENYWLSQKSIVVEGSAIFVTESYCLRKLYQGPSLQELITFSNLICNNKKRLAWITLSRCLTWLTLSWWRQLSYRNQSIDLLRKSMDWFLYDSDLHYERINLKLIFTD